MKRALGCYSNAFGAFGLRAAIERIGSTGLDALELALRGHDFGGLVIPESAVLTEASPDSEFQAIRAMSDEKKVKILSCNVGGANILTPAGLNTTIKRLRCAQRWFGVSVVVSGAGQPSNRAERAVMVENLRTLGDAAGELGVTAALETHKGPTQNAEAMLALMAEVDHPRIRLNFDTGNIAYYNRAADPVEELDRVKSFVRSVHLKDNRGGFEDWYFPAVGAGGSVDLTRVRQVLDEVGFSGPYTIEIEGIAGEPEPGLEGRVDRISRSVTHLAGCGYFD